MGDRAWQAAVEQAREGCFLTQFVLVVITIGVFLLLGPTLLTAALGALLIAGRLGLFLVDWAAGQEEWR